MSQTVQNVSFTEEETIRWEQFKLFKDSGLTDEEIAHTWGLTTRKQVTRLKTKAKQTGAYKQWMEDKIAWITEDFKELHALMKKKKPHLAYSVMAAMYAKTIPTSIESLNMNLNKTQTEVTVNVTNELLKQYENLFEEATLLEHCAPQPIHTTQANRETSTSNTT
jgi:hypothetical protein